MNIIDEKEKRKEFCKLLIDLSQYQFECMDIESKKKLFERLEILYQTDNPQTRYRHFYTDIFSVFSQFEDDAAEIVCSNLDHIRQEYQPIKIDIRDSLKKLYDHASLEMARINYLKSRGSNIAQGKEVDELGQKVNSCEMELDRQKTELATAVQRTQKDYIAILSIFSAVVMVFFSGVGFSSSVLANIHQASIYRIWISITLLGAVLFNSLWILFNFLREIIGKKQERWKIFLVANFLLLVSLLLPFIFAYLGLFSTI